MNAPAFSTEGDASDGVTEITRLWVGWGGGARWAGGGGRGRYGVLAAVRGGGVPLQGKAMRCSMPQCPLSAWACLPCAPGALAGVHFLIICLSFSFLVYSFCMFHCTIPGLGFLHCDVLITHRKEIH